MLLAWSAAWKVVVAMVNGLETVIVFLLDTVRTLLRWRPAVELIIWVEFWPSRDTRLGLCLQNMFGLMLKLKRMMIAMPRASQKLLRDPRCVSSN